MQLSLYVWFLNIYIYIIKLQEKKRQIYIIASGKWGVTLVYFGCVYFNVGYVTIPLEIYIYLYTLRSWPWEAEGTSEVLAIYISSQANYIIWISTACVAQKGLSVLPWGTSRELIFVSVPWSSKAPLNIFVLPNMAGEVEARLGISIMI